MTNIFRAEVTDFSMKHGRFKRATARMVSERSKISTIDERFRGLLEKFKQLCQDPMDEAWSRLTAEEKEAAWTKLKKR